MSPSSFCRFHLINMNELNFHLLPRRKMKIRASIQKRRNINEEKYNRQIYVNIPVRPLKTFWKRFSYSVRCQLIPSHAIQHKAPWWPSPSTLRPWWRRLYLRRFLPSRSIQSTIHRQAIYWGLNSRVLVFLFLHFAFFPAYLPPFSLTHLVLLPTTLCSYLAFTLSLCALL